MNNLSLSIVSKKHLLTFMTLAVLLFSLLPVNVTPVRAVSPANDAWQNATVISIPFSETVDTNQAEQENDEPVLDIPNTCNGQRLRAGVATVWYKYTAPANAQVAFDTLGSFQTEDINPVTGAPYPYDTYIAIWTWGTDPSDNLTLIACNDDTTAGYVSQVSFNAAAGTIYYIQAAQYNGKFNIVPYVAPPYQGGTLKFHGGLVANVNVNIGTSTMGPYAVYPKNEQRLYYDLSSGPVKVGSTNAVDLVAAIRLQSYDGVTLYSFVETMGVPSELLSYKYVFPTYNNTWAPLNSQIRFANLAGTTTRIRVTIGTANVWEEDVPGLQERRLYFNVSNGPVVVESLDSTKKIVAAIRLQSLAGNTLYSFSETMGIPFEHISDTYYFPTYNNTWPPLNSQLRFANLNAATTTVRVTIGGSPVWQDVVPGMTEKRLTFNISAGPVVVQSLDPAKKIVAAIRLQSYDGVNLYNFIETMGVPSGLLSYKYVFPTYNNTWAPLNSQVRFGNLAATTTRIRVTIGGIDVWEEDVPGLQERRLYFPVSSGPVVVESLDTNKKIVAAIRLQSYDGATLYSFSETMGIPFERLSDTYYFPTYNNTWQPLNSQLRLGVP